MLAEPPAALSPQSGWKEPCWGCAGAAWGLVGAKQGLGGPSPAPHLCPLQADLTVDTSVRGLLSVLPVLSEKHSGNLLNWEGKVIPW